MVKVWRVLLRFVALALLISFPSGAGWAQVVPAPNAVPQGGQVSAGTATIQQGGTATNPQLIITQQSDRAVINWQSFNLGRDASVNFQQPSASSVTLNRVLGSDPSSIFGKISSNGQIYLINPNGIYFSPTSSADVGGLVATTHNMRDDDFMAGSTTFTRDGATGKVINEGVLRARMGGYVALLAPEVRNAGIIVAKQGTVALAAGDAVTLNVDANNSLTNLLVKPSTMQALVDNQKIIKAPDGQVILSAQAYNEVAAGVINNSGEISAKGIAKSGGTIVLGATTEINQSGKINASAKTGNGGSIKLDANRVTQSGSMKADSLTGKGGTINVTGDVLALKAGASLSANGATGGGAVLVGGDWQGSNGVRQSQSVTVEQEASISANATQSGDGGKVVLWSDVTNKNSFTKFDGSIEATGFAGGKGGRVETSGHVIDVSNGSINVKSGGGDNGLWLIDPYDVTIVSTASGSGTPFSANFLADTTSSISILSLQNMLNAGTDVTISTGAVGSPGTDVGMITVSTAINKTAGTSATLTLSAAGPIAVNRDIISTSNALNLVLESYSSSTVTGILALGSGTLTKLGTSTITMASTSTYTGATTINGGTLKITNASGLGIAPGGAVTVNNGGTLDLQINIGSKPIVLAAGSTLANSSASAVTYGGPVTLNGNATFNTTANITLTGVVSGTGGLIKAGSGTLTLSGANTFSGGITVTAGYLTPNTTNMDGSGNPVAGALGIGNSVTMQGGYLTPSQNSLITSLSGTAGQVDLSNATLTFGGDNSSTTFAGTFGGIKALIKNGTGTFTNGATNLNTVLFTINNGVMILNHANAGAYSNFTIGANGTLDLNGKTIGTGTGINTTVHIQGSGYNGQGALINSSASAATMKVGNLYWDSAADVLINTTGNITLYATTVPFSGTRYTPTIVKTGPGLLDATNLGGTTSNTTATPYGNNAYNILQGTATLGSSSIYTTVGDVTVASGTSTTLAFGANGNYTGTISGAGNFTYSSTGTASSFLGTMTMTGGTVNFTATTSVAIGGPVTSVGPVNVTSSGSVIRLPMAPMAPMADWPEIILWPTRPNPSPSASKI